MNAEHTTILVVDDSELNREHLTFRLKRDGYTTLTAEGGQSALKVLQEKEIDLILLDFMMPDMDGYDVLLKIKADQKLHHIPVLMVSAMEEQESVIKCIEAGADDFMTKPVNSVLLRARIQKRARR